MRFIKKLSCDDCPVKCEIFNAARSSEIDDRLVTLHALYNKHEIICKQGNNVTNAMYLVNGNAKLYIEGLNNRNIILNILTPHRYIGLMSFFESVNYSYSVMTLDECHVCLIDLEFVRKLYVMNHELLLQLNQAFGKSVVSIMGKIISLNQKQIRGRVADSLLYLSNLYGSNRFNMGLTRKELGEMSAISEENAVRILTEFKKEDIINVDGKEVTINDVVLLQKISEVG